MEIEIADSLDTILIDGDEPKMTASLFTTPTQRRSGSSRCECGRTPTQRSWGRQRRCRCSAQRAQHEEMMGIVESHFVSEEPISVKALADVLKRIAVDESRSRRSPRVHASCGGCNCVKWPGAAVRRPARASRACARLSQIAPLGPTLARLSGNARRYRLQAADHRS